MKLWTMSAIFGVVMLVMAACGGQGSVEPGPTAEPAATSAPRVQPTQAPAVAETATVPAPLPTATAGPVATASRTKWSWPTTGFPRPLPQRLPLRNQWPPHTRTDASPSQRPQQSPCQHQRPGRARRLPRHQRRRQSPYQLLDSRPAVPQCWTMTMLTAHRRLLP